MAPGSDTPGALVAGSLADLQPATTQINPPTVTTANSQSARFIATLSFQAIGTHLPKRRHEAFLGLRVCPPSMELRSHRHAVPSVGLVTSVTVAPPTAATNSDSANLAASALSWWQALRTFRWSSTTAKFPIHWRQHARMIRRTRRIGSRSRRILGLGGTAAVRADTLESRCLSTPGACLRSRCSRGGTPLTNEAPWFPSRGHYGTTRTGAPSRRTQSRRAARTSPPDQDRSRSSEPSSPGQRGSPRLWSPGAHLGR